jgi:transposase
VAEWQVRVSQRHMLLVDLMATLTPQIKAYERELTHLLDQHADAFIFRSLPNAGDVTAAWLLEEIGDCRDKFENTSAMQGLPGSCPVTIQSNKRRYVKFRVGCCKSFRNAVQQFARLSARGKKGAPWAKGYLSDPLARGHSVSRATRALGNRWLAIIFCLWQDRVAYDEEIHLRDRALRGCRVAT